AAHWLEAAAAGPVEPALEVAIGSSLRVELPQLHGGLPERPRARHLGDDLAQQVEGTGFRPAASFRAAQPVVLGALEDRIALGQPRPVLTASQDRKSTRLNSSHDQISYAVFCLKKKKQKKDA